MSKIPPKSGAFSQDFFQASLKTPFPATFTARFERQSQFQDHVNIVKAHEMIENEYTNPYLAWALVLGHQEKDLPGLLGMNEDSCEILISHYARNPPPKNIHIFCDKLGIHPAHLIPPESDVFYSMPYTVLRAVTQIYKNMDMPLEDRETARECIQSEIDKYIDFKDVDPVVFSYFETAQKNMRDLSLTYNARETHDREVDYISTNPSSDVDLGLDILFNDLSSQLDRGHARFDNIDGKQKISYERMLEYGFVMFGPEYAEDSVDELLEKIMDVNQKKDNPVYWGLTHDGGVAGVTSRRQFYTRLESPELHPDFEVMAKMEGINPDDVLSDFTHLLSEHIALLSEKITLKNKIQGWEKGISAFVNWRRGSEAESWHIPLFANYMLSQRALGRLQTILDEPSDDKEVGPKPVKTSRHVVEYTMK